MIIRVDPALLKDFASTMHGTGSEVSSLGSGAAAAASSAPSYNGQFGPQVQAIGAETQARVSAFTTHLIDLSEKLGRKAVEFEGADAAALTGFTGAIYKDWAAEQAALLTRWSQLTGIPVATLERYLKLGMIFGGSQFYVLLFAMVMSNSVSSWTGATFSGLKVPGWLTFSVRQDLVSIGRRINLWPEKRGRPQGDDVRTHIAILQSEVWSKELTKGETKYGGVRLAQKGQIDLLQGEAGIGVRVGKGDVDVGGYGKVTGATVQESGVIGSTDLGLGAGVKATAGEAEAFIGLHDGDVGAEVGGKLVSGELTVGADVDGINVGGVLEAGIKFELGLKVGKKTRVYLGPFTLGLNVDKALGY